MPPSELPEGRYLSAAFRVPPEAGGQTRALLMRNRILALEGGVRPDVLTLAAMPDHSAQCETLRERGLVVDAMRLLNIYEHYRHRGWTGEAPAGVLEDLSRHRIREDSTPDGSPWRTVYQPPGSKRPIYEYTRADGSPYLRIPRFNRTRRSTWPDRIQRIGADGALVGEFHSLGQWFRRWIRELLGVDERAFLFIDSRFVVPHLVPMRGSRIHLIYLMHNVHVRPPRRWDSEIDPVYRRVLRRIGGMDAMVTLTERQRDDIAARRGRTSNLFVVPNPVVMPAPPAQEAPRDPCRVTVVARLEPQKRLTDAVAAFAQVVEAVPAARLDIYGEGSERPRLEAEIEQRALGRSVALRGFDARAADTLWTSSAFLMTSSFEGYPLSTIESMARGCPVVSYDVKYGPREQITDGVDGFLVPARDVDRLAQRVIELLRSPELFARMSASARASAQRYGPAEFLARWAGVLHAVVEHKRLRTRIDDIALEVTRLRPLRFRRLQFDGLLRVRGHSRGSAVESADIELAAVHDAGGEVIPLPVRARWSDRDDAFRLRARISLEGVFHAGPEARLRLRFLWRNSSWETEVAQLADEDGLRLTRPAEPARA